MSKLNNIGIKHVLLCINICCENFKAGKVLILQYFNSFNEQIKFHTQNPTDKSYWIRTMPASEYELHVLYDFLVTVKAAPHECVIRTGLP